MDNLHFLTFLERRRVLAWALILLVAGTVETGSTAAAPAQEDPVLEAAPAPGPRPGAVGITLGRAVATALEKNFGILAAGDSVAAARLRETASRSQFYPTLTPQYQRSTDDQALALDASQRLPWTGGRVSAFAAYRSNLGNDLPPSRFSDLRLLLTQPLLRGFGPTATNFELANSRRARESQERALELGRQKLAVQVAAAFYQILQQRQLLAVAEQSLKRSDGLRRASEARLEVGLVSKLDVFRAQLQASQAEEAMVRAEVGLEDALERFRVLLGLSPTDPVEPEAAALPERLEDVEPVQVLVARALANRVELVETRDQVADARRAASVSRQALLPQVDLNLGLTRSGFGTTLADTLRGTDRGFTFFVTTSYPLARSAAVAAKATAELEVAARDRALHQRRLEIESEVRAAARDMERIRKSVDLQGKAVDVAESQLRLATLRYQRGLASNFDVVDAESNVIVARTALVGLRTSYQIARIELLRVTGSLDPAREFAP
jgi:outer membrane protein TolC